MGQQTKQTEIAGGRSVSSQWSRKTTRNLWKYFVVYVICTGPQLRISLAHCATLSHGVTWRPSISVITPVQNQNKSFVRRGSTAMFLKRDAPKSQNTDRGNTTVSRHT